MTARTPGQRVRQENYIEAENYIKAHPEMEKTKLISRIAKRLSVSAFKAREYVEIYFDNEDDDDIPEGYKEIHLGHHTKIVKDPDYVPPEEN